MIGNESLYYGTKATTTSVLGGFSFSTTVTASYSPPWRFPLSLSSGSSFTNNASTVTFETDAGIAGISSTTQSQTVTYKFLGIENVSVAAGTFSTCKVENTTVSVVNGQSSTSTSTQWTIASGELKGLFVKSQGTDGAVSEAKLVQLGH